MVCVQRLPRGSWQVTRKKISERNRSSYQVKVNKSSAQLKRIISGKLGCKKSEKMRTLHGRCCLIVIAHRYRRIILKSFKK